MLNEICPNDKRNKCYSKFNDLASYSGEDHFNPFLHQLLHRMVICNLDCPCHMWFFINSQDKFLPLFPKRALVEVFFFWVWWNFLSPTIAEPASISICHHFILPFLDFGQGYISNLCAYFLISLTQRRKLNDYCLGRLKLLQTHLREIICL